MSQFDIPLDAYPSGVIVWFHGDETDVPDNWAVCDGNNGTPNLLERFPRSVPDSATDPGATGGVASKTLSTSQIPSHSHSDNSTSQSDEHNHEFQCELELAAYTDPSNVVVENHGASFWEKKDPMGYSGSHTHSASANNTGNGDAIDNRPAFTDLIPIQKQ